VHTGSLPRVSVVIPVYNGTNYLREAIESVLAQTFPDYELIVVDDGSTDATWDLIQSYGKEVRGFRKFNGGVASALNLGLQEMRGRWFAWLSHDDLWMPTKLEEQVAFLRESSHFKACYTDYIVIDAHGNTLREVVTPWYPRVKALRTLFGQMYIGGSTMLIERSCFDTVGLFKERLRMTQDVDMWVRLLRRFEIGRVPKKLAKERVHGAQDSRRLAVYEAEKVATFGCMFDDLAPAELFPELAQSLSTAQLTAHAHVWFADTMARYRGYDDLARAHYRRAVEADLAWTNRVHFKCWALSVRRWLGSIYRRARRVV
jgi:glycosyltransferase involved in cell wall biosynthesis